MNIDISAEEIIMTANSNGRAEKKGSSIIMLQISKKERNSGKLETDAMSVMWLLNSRSQRLASLMSSSLAIMFRTANGV